MCQFNKSSTFQLVLLHFINIIQHYVKLCFRQLKTSSVKFLPQLICEFIWKKFKQTE